MNKFKQAHTSLGYYLKLFPDVQQKTASGFLTTLWAQDAFRNKWALVAKVYSFVRDEAGKKKVALGDFLGIACPIMSIIDPSEYLDALGWSVEEDDNGSEALVRDNIVAATFTATSDIPNIPSTELELLISMINVGYLPEDGFALVELMKTNSNGMITTNARGHISSKVAFMATAKINPYEAARQILPLSAVSNLQVRAHVVGDVNSSEHFDFQVSENDPRRYYEQVSAGTLPCPSNGTLNINGISEHEFFDMNSPWDIDAMINSTLQPGFQYSKFDAFLRRNFSLTLSLAQQENSIPSPPYNSEADFHFIF